MNTPAVGVVIGLIFTFLIVSLVASAIKETIAAVFQWRGTYLQHGIKVLLSSEVGAAFSWGGPVCWIVAHFTRIDLTRGRSVVTKASDAADRLSAVLSHPLLKGTPTKLPSYVPARDFATAMLDMLRDGSANPVFSQVERSVATLPDGDIKRILSAFLQDAAGDLDKFRTRIETWFDDAMDRLSGIYKRNCQYFLLALGLMMAIVLNIDAVHLGTALWLQPDARAKIVADAQAALATADVNHLTAWHDAMQQLDGLPMPIGRVTGASLFGEPVVAECAVVAAPVEPARPEIVCPSYRSGWRGWNWWTLIGWVATAFAISLGAPFWFDLLQNIMHLRDAGPPPKRSDALAE
jgi:hypothetical protein